MLGPLSTAWSEKVWRRTLSTCRTSGHRPVQKSRRGSTSICSGIGPWRHEYTVTESSVGEREHKKKSRESDADHARRRRRREKEHQEAEHQVIAETASARGS